MTDAEQPQPQEPEQNNNQEQQELDVSPPEEMPQEQPIKRIFNYERVDKSRR